MGGTHGEWEELNIVTIILTAYFWNIKGSLFIALLLGIIVGKFMPLNVSQIIMKFPKIWLLRISIYLTVAFISGYIFRKNNEMQEKIKEKDLISPLTGIYNINKLFYDLEKLSENEEKYCLIIFKVVNLGKIFNYVNPDIVNSIINKGIENTKKFFPGNELYEANTDEHILLLKEYDENNIMEKLKNYVNIIPNSILVDNEYFNLVVKLGVSFYNGDKSAPKEQYIKARIAADKGEVNESGVYYYDIDFDNQRKLYYEIAGSLQKAIDNKEFYLVYQPIISLKDSKISSVEVLIRWNRGERQPVGPDIFIKIAEEVGLITEISKWIVEELNKQIAYWKDKGLDVKASINLSSREILDNSFQNWSRRTIEEIDINQSNFTIELTERMFSKDRNKLSLVLSDLRNKGYKISIDDFGTGYNSLMTICEIPFDIIKIDKYFIDRLARPEIKVLIDHIIKVCHKSKVIVVSEGVETKEQFEALKELGCDMIQGYYFSKPLLPEEYMEYHAAFFMDDYL